MALYGPAAISYFSGDGSNLLRGTSYAISRGNLSVSGSITGGSKSLEIDHPTDIYNKDLVLCPQKRRWPVWSYGELSS